MLKGYQTDNGYRGLVGDEYMLFETDGEYYEYMEAIKNDEKEMPMTVYAVIYTCGYSSGYKELIGVYNTKKKAEVERDRDMNTTVRPAWNYSIKPIEVDKTIKITYMEW